MTELTCIGFDDWDRFLFKTDKDVTLVDVNGELYTRTPDWGELCDPTGLKSPVYKKGNGLIAEAGPVIAKKKEKQNDG